MKLDNSSIWRLTTFLFPPGSIGGNEIIIDGPEGHHAADVLRVHAGDTVRVIDGEGMEALATVAESGGGVVRANVIETRQHLRSDGNELTVAQALLKGRTFDEVVRRCSELGVGRIVPLSTERSIGRIPSDALESRLERWRGIAAAAVKQSRGVFLPLIEPPHEVGALEAMVREADLALIAWEEESAVGLGDALEARAREKAPREAVGPPRQRHHGSIILIVGPEGGLSGDEVEILKGFGAGPVSAGRRILKADWAAAAIAAMISSETGGLLP